MASPTFTMAPVESNPTIWVADFPRSIWKAPRPVPNPPVWNVGTGSFTILLRLEKNVARTIQVVSVVRTGETAAPISTPVLRSLPPLMTRLTWPVESGMRGSSNRFVIVFW